LSCPAHSYKKSLPPVHAFLAKGHKLPLQQSLKMLRWEKGMAKSVEARRVGQVIRRYLRGKGYTLSQPKKHGQTGVDITATRGESTLFMEVIGFQDHPPTRSREFYECFFRVISRDGGNPSDVLAMGLPRWFKDGMRQRKRNYSVAWEKLGRAFPNLKIWYVDTEQNVIEEFPWAKPFN